MGLWYVVSEGEGRAGDGGEAESGEEEEESGGQGEMEAHDFVWWECSERYRDLAQS